MKRAVAGLLLLSMILGATSFIFPVAGADETENYTAHAPISINGDDDLAAQAASEGWPGSGTESDPYLIEDYEIDMSLEDGTAIFISGTDLFVEIVNCYIHGNYQGNEGIGISKVSNLTITACNFSELVGSFTVNDGSTNILLDSLDIWRIGGIRIGNDITIENCVFDDCGHLSVGSYNSIRYNQIINTGISLSGSCYNKIYKNNMVADKFDYDDYRLDVKEQSNANEIYDNTFEKGTIIFREASREYLNPKDNLIYNNYFGVLCFELFPMELAELQMWNITKTLGENIIGGPYLGGNYWRGCGEGGNEDGIAEAIYYDYLPLAPVNQAPIANFSYEPQNPKVGEVVQFFENCSDPDGEIWDGISLSYAGYPGCPHLIVSPPPECKLVAGGSTVNIWSWDFGTDRYGTNDNPCWGSMSTAGEPVDWPQSHLQNPTHRYSEPGMYNVTLRVMDNLGATTFHRITIEVEEKGIISNIPGFEGILAVLVVSIVAVFKINTYAKRKRD